MFEIDCKQRAVRPLLPSGEGWDEGRIHCALGMKRSSVVTGPHPGPLPRGEGVRVSPCLLIVLAVMVLCVWLPGGRVFAQQAQADSDVLAALVDEDYNVRQAQTRRLLMDDGLTPGAIDRLYVESTSPEQRNRLLCVARHHLIRRLIEARFGDQPGPGSMGLSHQIVRVTGTDGEQEVTGVMVVMTLPGFPAYASLEPGDVIIAFAGQPFPERMSQNLFQQMILQHQAGEAIDLVILRQGKAEQVRFVLCQGAALNQVYVTGGVTLGEPYQRLWSEDRSRMRALLEDQPSPE